MQQRLLSRLLFGALAALGANAHAVPCAGFNDVDDTNTFCTSVAWMKNRAITLGCVSDGSLYCPDQFVRRDQMAAFLYRLGVQNAFLRGGNAFGATAVLGTTDGQSLDLVVEGVRAMSFRPNVSSPNILGGHPNNAVNDLTSGQVVAGGGQATSGCLDPETQTNTRSCGNRTTKQEATVSGGLSNHATGYAAVVAGGIINTASGDGATVSGGSSNAANGSYSTVVGGTNHVASGLVATILGGNANRATGDFSVAAGHNARADQHYCMVFGAWASGEPFSCLGAASIVRFGADHGLSVDYAGRRVNDGGGTRWVYFGDLTAGRTINTWTGAHLTDAGVWVNAASSRERKTDFGAVDANDVLEKVAALPITTWRYREGEGEVRHIGPMAEDFHAAFDVGYGPHTIADLDARGVAFAAIQGLHRQLRAREAELAAQRTTIEALEARLRLIESSVATARER